MRLGRCNLFFDGAVLGVAGVKRGCGKLQVQPGPQCPESDGSAVKMAPVAMGHQQTSLDS